MQATDNLLYTFLESILYIFGINVDIKIDMKSNEINLFNSLPLKFIAFKLNGYSGAMTSAFIIS